MIHDQRQNRRIANMAQLGYSEEDMRIGRERDAKAQRKRERRQETELLILQRGAA